MTIEECKSCKYNQLYSNGAVHCSYDQNVMSMAVVKDPKTKAGIILTCPRDKSKKR